VIIYKATNKENGKIYVGQTVQPLHLRQLDHRKKSRDKRCKVGFPAAVRKYGWDAFSWEVIDTAETIEELNDKEIYWISHLDTYHNGYNLTKGGGGTHGYNHSEETRGKMLGRKRTEQNVIEDSVRQGSKPFSIYDINGNNLGSYVVKSWCARDFGLHNAALGQALSSNRYTTDNYIVIPDEVYSDELLKNRIDYLITRGKGTGNGRATLTEEVVRAIKLARKETGISYPKLADKFGTTKWIVADILRGRTWTHVIISDAQAS
jgi:hypothetical protein